MKNQCKTDARKSDAKMMENERKWNPNGSQHQIKIHKNEVEKSMRKSMRKKEGLWPGAGPCRMARGTT